MSMPRAPGGVGGQSQEEEGFLHGSPVEVWVRERRVRRAAEERAWDVGRETWEAARLGHVATCDGGGECLCDAR